KKGKPGSERFIENYKQSIRHLAANGVTTVCYNFMPVLDWTRTDLGYVLDDGSKALRFDAIAFTAFDLFVLKRPRAEKAHPLERIALAEDFMKSASDDELRALQQNVLAGLPGAEEGYTLEQFQAALDEYKQVDDRTLRKHLYHFISEVAPVAEQAGVRLTIHPDDPPFPIFGLPRVLSTEADAVELFKAHTGPANGLCFCTGSFGVRADSDLPGMVARLGERIHFIHLRSTLRDENGSFFEAD